MSGGVFIPAAEGAPAQLLVVFRVPEFQSPVIDPRVIQPLAEVDAKMVGTRACFGASLLAEPRASCVAGSNKAQEC